MWTHYNVTLLSSVNIQMNGVSTNKYDDVIQNVEYNPDPYMDKCKLEKGRNTNRRCYGLLQI